MKKNFVLCALLGGLASACGGGGFSLPADATVIEQQAAMAAFTTAASFTPGFLSPCTADCQEVIGFTHTETETTLRFIVIDATGEPTLNDGDVVCEATYTRSAAPVAGFAESERQVVTETVVTQTPADCTPLSIGESVDNVYAVTGRDDAGRAASLYFWSFDNAATAPDTNQMLFWDGGGALPFKGCTEDDASTVGSVAYCPSDCVWDFMAAPMGPDCAGIPPLL